MPDADLRRPTTKTPFLGSSDLSREASDPTDSRGISRSPRATESHDAGGSLDAAPRDAARPDGNADAGTVPEDAGHDAGAGGAGLTLAEGRLPE